MCQKNLTPRQIKDVTNGVLNDAAMELLRYRKISPNEPDDLKSYYDGYNAGLEAAIKLLSSKRR